jgi:predicted nucleic acid-binding protein
VTFVDTSALFAALDRDDTHHRAAADRLGAILGRDEAVTHGYVVVETAALVQRRLGQGVVMALLQHVVPLLHVQWIDETLHRAGVETMRALDSRAVSLVDAVSFAFMRREGITDALAFDRHFEDQGFRREP